MKKIIKKSILLSIVIVLISSFNLFAGVYDVENITDEEYAYIVGHDLQIVEDYLEYIHEDMKYVKTKFNVLLAKGDTKNFYIAYKRLTPEGTDMVRHGKRFIGFFTELFESEVLRYNKICDPLYEIVPVGRNFQKAKREYKKNPDKRDKETISRELDEAIQEMFSK